MLDWIDNLSDVIWLTFLFGFLCGWFSVLAMQAIDRWADRMDGRIFEIRGREVTSPIIETEVHEFGCFHSLPPRHISFNCQGKPRKHDIEEARRSMRERCIQVPIVKKRPGPETEP